MDKHTDIHWYADHIHSFSDTHTHSFTNSVTHWNTRTYTHTLTFTLTHALAGVRGDQRVVMLPLCLFVVVVTTSWGNKRWRISLLSAIFISLPPSSISLSLFPSLCPSLSLSLSLFLSFSPCAQLCFLCVSLVLPFFFCLLLAFYLSAFVSLCVLSAFSCMSMFFSSVPPPFWHSSPFL